MTPAAVAAEALRLAPGTVTQVEPIKHGLTNESWLVRAREQAVVVRLSNAATESLRIDRASEAIVLDAVAEAGIGPPVLLNDPQRRVLVTRYIGDPWTFEEAGADSRIRLLASRLHRLHELRVPRGVRTVDLLETVQGYLGTLDEQGEQSQLTSEEWRTRATQTALELRAASVPCLCHNDVHHLNVVGRGEPMLIDWEYAGSGDPAFDLASVCVYHRYGPAQRSLLLDAYGAAGRGVDAGRLGRACWIFEYVRDLWTAVRGLDEANR